MEDAIVNRQPRYNDAWAWVNKDDKVGSEIWIFDQDEIVLRRYEIKFNQRWRKEGDWEIHGQLTAPNPCQGRLVALNQQKTKIKEIEESIRELQNHLRLAAPALKPAITAEIELVRTEQLAPAKEQLVPLQRALAKCYAPLSVQPDIGGLVIGPVIHG